MVPGLEGLTPQQVAYFAILLAVLVLLATEWIGADLVAVLAMLALIATGVLAPPDAFDGLRSEAAIVAASVLVLSAGLRQTGLAEVIGGWIGRVAGGSPVRFTGVLMLAAAPLAGVAQHLTVTALLLPAANQLARQRKIAVSRLLIPISFAASLGSAITVIGAPAFVVASDTLQQAGRPGLGLFSIAPIGLAISLAGAAYMVLLGRYLLPDRGGADALEERFGIGDYHTELVVLPESPFLGKTVDEVDADHRYVFEVIGWVRGGRPLPRPFGDRRLEAGDVLLVRTSADQLATIRSEPGVELNPVHQYREEAGERGVSGRSDRLVQVVVAPGADLVGRTIAEIGFHRRYGVVVLGLWRRGETFAGEMAHIRLRPGDVLLLQGDEDAVARVVDDPSSLMALPFRGEPEPRRKAPLAAAIMLATVAVAALGLARLHVAMLAGAVAMVLLGCLSTRQAYRAMDPRLYLFIAGGVVLGRAMQQTGAAGVLAGALQALVGGWNQVLVLLALFAVVGALTQFLSDTAAAALFAPVAVALAQGLGQPPEPYVVAVAVASVAAFGTPTAHDGSMLIYGAGRYRFGDFVRVGVPLTLLIAPLVALLAPLLWPA